jgi:hypothetical protein
VKVVNKRNIAVIVPLPLGGEVEVAPGDVLSTSDEHGRSLLEQPANWEAEPESKKQAPVEVKSAPAEDETE